MKRSRFHLTRHAALALSDIYARSTKAWGEKKADEYLAEIYAVMNKAVAKPETGRLRGKRAAPFCLLPAGKHFVVYDFLDRDVVVVAVLHQSRDIESVIKDFTPDFLAEIATLREEI